MKLKYEWKSEEGNDLYIEITEVSKGYDIGLFDTTDDSECHYETNKPFKDILCFMARRIKSNMSIEKIADIYGKWLDDPADKQRDHDGPWVGL